MKNLITIFIIFISTSIYKPIEYVKIEHVGPSDKPIPTVIISEDSIKFPGTDAGIIYCDLVDKNDYNRITAWLGGIKSNKPGIAEFGTFEMSVISDSKITAEYYLNKKSSLQLFDKMIEELKKENKSRNLVSDLEELKKRLGS